jgi:hypothetical protein
LFYRLTSGDWTSYFGQHQNDIQFCVNGFLFITSLLNPAFYFLFSNANRTESAVIAPHGRRMMEKHKSPPDAKATRSLPDSAPRLDPTLLRRKALMISRSHHKKKTAAAAARRALSTPLQLNIVYILSDATTGELDPVLGATIWKEGLRSRPVGN